MPIRLFETSFALVFEEFVNRREYDAGAFCADAHVKIDFVVHKVNVAVTHNAEKLSRHIEILSMNNSVPHRKFRPGVPGNAVANTWYDVKKDVRNRTTNRN